MGMQRELERQGNWLFRWRSYLPLAIVPLLILAIANMHWPLGSYRLHEVIEFSCLGISFAGLFIRILAVGYAPAGTSGRNTKMQLASSLSTTGVYSLVRHPLYLGNYLIGLGVVLVPAAWWLPLVYTLIFWLYYERIMFAEESFLRDRFGDAFTNWARTTPAFVPNPRLWLAPAQPFSLRKACKGEYHALALIILLHAGIECAEHLVIEHRIPIEIPWLILLSIGCGGYFVVRALKKHTRLLDQADVLIVNESEPMPATVAH